MYQSTAISSYFTTQGYLIPIVSVLAVAILPRDKFLQALVVNVLFICIASAVSLLAIWSSVQARLHTSLSVVEGPATAPLPYNSSQSAVCAVWLFVNIWLANLIRAKMPSFNLPAVIYSILVNTSLTAGPTIGTTAVAEAFVRQLLLANLFGMGLAAGVCLLVFPVNSRVIAMGEFKRLIGLLRDVVRLQGEHLAALAQNGSVESNTAEEQDAWQGGRHVQSYTAATRRSKAGVVVSADGLEETIGEIRRLAGQLYGDMVFAKRDIAWGKLDASNMAEIFTLMYNLVIPIVAMTTGMRVLEQGGRKFNDKVVGPGKNIAGRTPGDGGRIEQVHALFQLLAEPIDQGLEHAGICLEILPQPKKYNTNKPSGANPRPVDIEDQDGGIQPGDERFGVLLIEKVRHVCTQRDNILQNWLSEQLPAVQGSDPTHPQSKTAINADDIAPGHRSQFWMSLYLEQLMLAAGEAIQSLIAFADKKVNDGTMKHRRLIIPSKHRLLSWLESIVSKKGSGAAQNPGILDVDDDDYGDGYSRDRDPERLPPTGTWQHLGSGLYSVSKFFGSKESAFGFRVACAAMSISILAFLEKTQSFFQDQRLLWAMLTIAIGMTITSGQSVFGFFCRVGATSLAMVSSLAIWYIPDQKTPGIIAFLWLSILIEYYFIKFPRLKSPVIITVTTQLVIVGYELQVGKLGEAVATRSGQPYYP
ncbi:hypothetical protein ED733_000423 [Metarhizium rileyi]|uniref:Uncharacterized protein n=1 Tax=Metarhizium rileyi (strain RCEF 4871) TaxID=1649241 RepID=A0A5C6G4N6_METRR|nr:hypothetical protein ED733_000423 [Metarhizium rileyi]